MALNDEILARTIESELESAGFKPLLADSTAGHKYYLALAKAFNKHQKEFAEVQVTGGSSAGTYKVT